MQARRILVPLDGSPFAEGAVRKALEYGDHALELVLLRSAQARPWPTTDPLQAQVDAVVETEMYLKTAAARAFKSGARAVETHVWYGPPAPAIIEAAEVLDVDLIVMATHGRDGLGRLVFGSVAESVLRGSKKPLLLLHGRESTARLGTRPRRFWCLRQDREVEVVFEGRGLPGLRPAAVKSCSAFDPPTAVA